MFLLFGYLLDINNSIIIQYGFITDKYAGDTITYPIAFSRRGTPLVCLHYSAANIGNANYQLHIYSNITSSFQIGTVNSSAEIFCSYIACGY